MRTSTRATSQPGTGPARPASAGGRSLATSTPFGYFARRGQGFTRCVDVDGGRTTRYEQRDVDCAYAGTDVEHTSSIDPLADDDLDQLLRRRVEPAARRAARAMRVAAERVRWLAQQRK